MAEATAVPKSGLQHDGTAVLQAELLALSAGQPFTVYIVNGIKLDFKTLLGFDDVCLKAMGDRGASVIFFHAISTISPASGSARRN